MRRNSASEVCTSSATRMRETIGIMSRLCRVENATRVPADSTVPPTPPSPPVSM